MYSNRRLDFTRRINSISYRC